MMARGRVRKTLYSASGNLLAQEPKRVCVCVYVCVFMELPLAKQGNLVGEKVGFFFLHLVRIVVKPDVT